MQNHCPNCGIEIEDADESCKNCGEIIIRSSKIPFYLIILIFIGLFLILGYYIQSYFDDYETRTIYVEVPYQEPVYKTLYSGTLTYCVYDNYGCMPPYTFKDATSYNIENNILYSNVKICYDSKCEIHPARGGFDKIQAYPSQIVIGNQTKYRNEAREITKKIWDWYFS